MSLSLPHRFRDMKVGLLRYGTHAYDPNQPRDPGGEGGGQWTETGVDEGTEEETGGGQIKLTPSDKRAYEGKQVKIETKLTKRETGQLGEQAVIAHLQAQGFEDARPLNVETENFPVDLVQNHELIEVKTGLASNGKDAQRWRATIGQPGVNERAWLKVATVEEKSIWNQAKSQAIMDRKLGVLADFSKEHGVQATGKTFGTIINPDTGIIDLYEFDGFHMRIGWNSAQAKAGYVGSYKYETSSAKASIRAAAKSTQQEARYVDKAPKAEVRCDRCTMWRAPSSCTAVEGEINPGGSCRYFEAKK